MNAPDSGALVSVGNLDRKQYLGGSDIAAIMGLSPWATPLDVYLKKTGQAPDEIPADKARIFRRGKRLEPIAIDMLIEEYGINVVKRSSDTAPNRYVDQDYPFMAAEIDFEWVDDDGAIQNGEIKTVHNLVAWKWGDSETEDIPIEYAAQVAWGLGITRRDKTIVGALIGADNLLKYDIAADAETIEAMRATAIKFWHENVLAHVPPDPVNMDDMIKLFARTRGRPVELNNDAMALLGMLKAARDGKKTCEAREEEAKFKLCDYIRLQWGLAREEAPQDNAILQFAGKPLATWNAQTATRIDVDRLRFEQPQTAAEFTKTSYTRVLRIKKEKQ